MQIYSKLICKFVLWGQRHDRAEEYEDSPCCKATQKAFSGGETMTNVLDLAVMHKMW